MRHYRYNSDWWITFTLQIIASAMAIAMIVLCSCRSHRETSGYESFDMSASADSVCHIVSKIESLNMSVASEAALTFDSVSVTQAACCPSESESKTPKAQVIKIYGGSLAHTILAKAMAVDESSESSTEVTKKESSKKEMEKKSETDSDKSAWFVAGFFIFICALFLIMLISKKDVS